MRRSPGNAPKPRTDRRDPDATLASYVIDVGAAGGISLGRGSGVVRMAPARLTQATSQSSRKR